MQVLNFYSTVFADQMKRGRKTATIRLGDKRHKYRKNQVVLVTVGYQYSPREKLFHAVIDNVEVKRVKDLSPRDIEHDNPEFRRTEELVHFMEQIYGARGVARGHRHRRAVLADRREPARPAGSPAGRRRRAELGSARPGRPPGAATRFTPASEGAGAAGARRRAEHEACRGSRRDSPRWRASSRAGRPVRPSTLLCRELAPRHRGNSHTALRKPCSSGPPSRLGLDAVLKSQRSRSHALERRATAPLDAGVNAEHARRRRARRRARRAAAPAKSERGRGAKTLTPALRRGGAAGAPGAAGAAGAPLGASRLERRLASRRRAAACRD